MSLWKNDAIIVVFAAQGVVRDTGGCAVMLKWTMSNIYGLQPGEVSAR